MKILKTMVAVNDGANSGIDLCDTIEYEGKLWLVPAWIVSPDRQSRKPARIICMHGLRYQNAPQGADYVLNDPMPKSLFEPGQPQVGPEFVYRDMPNIVLSIVH
jgi:hypothetical protein